MFDKSTFSVVATPAPSILIRPVSMSIEGHKIRDMALENQVP